MTIDDIKHLRERTGASLQACKIALEEAKGDETLAIEILRKKGESKAAGRSDRETTQGVVTVATQGNKAVILKLGSETDFVAKTPDFIKAAEDIAQTLLKDPSFDATALLSNLNAKMGEKISLNNVQHVEGAVVGAYVHSNRKVGGVVVMNGGSQETAYDIAMHVTAMNPLVLSPAEVSEELVKKEREIWTEQLKTEGKPEAIVEKILMGKEKKFREENALLKQAFVKNPEQTVESLLNGATIEKFIRLEC
ncbi:MAG: translation elongation factor Ts [Candidatus Gracilibacteria bacterium]|jgi:elongation factor Ts